MSWRTNLAVGTGPTWGFSTLVVATRPPTVTPTPAPEDPPGPVVNESPEPEAGQGLRSPLPITSFLMPPVLVTGALLGAFMPASRRTSVLLPWGPAANARRRTRHSECAPLNIREDGGLAL